MNDGSEATVDGARLAQLKSELGEHFARVFGYFREDGIKSIEQIEAAIASGSAVALVRPAHTLKGESLQFGAMALGLAAERIEKAARAAVEAHGFPADTGADAARLRPLFDAAVAMLEREATHTAPLRRGVGFGRKVGFGRA